MSVLVRALTKSRSCRAYVLTEMPLLGRLLKGSRWKSKTPLRRLRCPQKGLGAICDPLSPTLNIVFTYSNSAILI